MNKKIKDLLDEINSLQAMTKARVIELTGLIERELRTKRIKRFDLYTWNGLSTTDQANEVRRFVETVTGMTPRESAYTVQGNVVYEKRMQFCFAGKVWKLKRTDTGIDEYIEFTLETV